MLCVLGSARAQQILPVASPNLAAEVGLPSVGSEPTGTAADAVPDTPVADAAPAPPAPDTNSPTPSPPPASSTSSPGDAVPNPSTGPEPTSDGYHWLDRAHQEVYDAVWHSSMRVDRWFGSERDEDIYQKGAYGSLAPALLFDQYNHFKELLRFNANFPIPQIDERFHAFVGRVNPEEYITERDEPSGAFARQYGPTTEDETIFGLGFHTPSKQGGYFDAGAGVRIALPMNPYIKGSYVYELGAS